MNEVTAMTEVEELVRMFYHSAKQLEAMVNLACHSCKDSMLQAISDELEKMITLEVINNQINEDGVMVDVLRIVEMDLNTFDRPSPRKLTVYDKERTSIAEIITRSLPRVKRVIRVRRVTDNPVDNYLYITLCEIEDGDLHEYVTWVFNSQDNGLHNGHYFSCDDFVNAVGDYAIRR